ncbi:MAG: alpha/beta fold hydrolase [Chloroflexi bacterium]|nr:alpha/beta fold hydrolase [Chloroflexota bacterium]
MKTLSRWLMALLLFTLATAALAQDDAITLTPFTNPSYGIQGMIPAGWQDMGRGLYGRSPATQDVTLLALQAVPAKADQVLQSLLPQLLLTEAPESVGTRETDAFTWTLYHVEVDARGVQVAVDLALAEQDGKTYLALLQTTPEESEALHENVFLPVLAAYQPLTTEVTPDPSLPYRSENVTFDNGEVTLSGTLTLPEGDGPFPAVVLVSGSGPQDRDESLLPAAEIKPFQLLADGLTRAGIAVLRYDDRGVGASSGDFTSATTRDFAGDAAAAIDYLLSREDIIPQQIGVLGHSEGGIVAAILGAENPNVAFIISLAGPGVSGMDVLLKQNERILQVSGARQEVIDIQLEYLNQLYDLIESGKLDAIEPLIADTLTRQAEYMTEEERAAVGDLDAYVAQTAAAQAEQFATSWWKEFLSLNPANYWAKTTEPVLVIFGSRDVQVDAEQNAPAVEAALQEAGNKDVTVVVIPDMNHLGQQAETGGLEEYGTLEPTFHPDLLPTITGWLLARVDAAGEQ